MPWQLIYTSAPRGLLSGQTGFCTVARSADLREALVQRLEQISSYHYLRVSEAATANRNPTISAFRLLDFRGAKYYVLTRIQPCGLDFTARTNHVAHHLVFQPDELGKLPTPAALLCFWPGWMASWRGEPRLLEAVNPADFAAAAKPMLPAQTWAQMTGDGGRAAGLLESECVRGCYLLCPPGSEEQVLQMFGETLELLNPEGRFPLRPWRHTFTTFLQAEDNANDFHWRACQENTPAYKLALSCSAPMIRLQSVRVPANDLVKRARDGPKPPPPPPPEPTDGSSAPTPAGSRPLRLATSTREVRMPPPTTALGAVKGPALPQRSSLINRTFSIRSSTLWRLGIFVAVLAVLLVVNKFKRPAGQGNPGPPAVGAASPITLPPVKTTVPVTAEQGARQSAPLTGDGPTYILLVPNLAQFDLPIDSIIALQNLLHRYDRQDPGALPNDLRVEMNTDLWDFHAGPDMKVEGRTTMPQFKASLGDETLTFDYASWLEHKGNSLAVQTSLNRESHAFSVHIGFSPAANGDPFRLLFVNEKNPPPPLPFSKEALENVGRAWRLVPNFHLLADAQWKVQPFIASESHPGQSDYLYNGWPSEEKPEQAVELDFSKARPPLVKTEESLNNKLNMQMAPLSLPVGKVSGSASTNSDLVSFWAFARTNLTQARFLDYLDELRAASPKKSWIKKWRHNPDADPADDMPGKFGALYAHWTTNHAPEEPSLLITNAQGTNNYFLDTWQRLKEIEALKEKLAAVRKRLFDLDRAYVSLCIVEPNWPRPALEMIRFGGP